MASFQCGPADVSSAWSFQQMPFHTLHRRGPWDHAYEGAYASQRCHETSYCSPVKGKQKKISKEEVPPPPKFSFGNLLYEDREYFVRFHSPLDDAASLCA